MARIGRYGLYNVKENIIVAEDVTLPHISASALIIYLLHASMYLCIQIYCICRLFPTPNKGRKNDVPGLSLENVLPHWARVETQL